MQANSVFPPETPLYNIGAVTRLTGFSAAVLHAWEKRYGFPNTGRTAGGHRLYTQADVARLRWIARALDEGMRTRQAVQAALQLSGQALREPLQGSQPADPEGLRRALLAGDLAEADRELATLQASHPPEELVLSVIQPLLEDLGERWERGELSIAGDHLASGYLRRVLQSWLNTGVPLQAGPPIVLACAPGEMHEGGLLMLAVLLRRRGWPVQYLGQSLPLEELSGLAGRLDPAVIVFAAMTRWTALALRDWPAHLPPAPGRRQPLVAFGGRAFVEEPTLQKQIQGVYLGDTLGQAVEHLGRLPGTAPTG